MIKIRRTPTPPASLAHEKTIKSGSYSCDDVKVQLHSDFHGKCYICEFLLLDRNVEHLLPHHNAQFPDPEKDNYELQVKHWERKFDWFNLFPSCVHCNSLKGIKEHIIDCCNIDPERAVRQKLVGAEVLITANDPEDKSAKETAALIKECFATTGPRHLDADARKALLQISVSVVDNELKRYKDMKQDKKDLTMQYELLRQLVQDNKVFAGFVRTEVRDYLDCCPELAPLVAFHDQEDSIATKHDRTEVSV